MKKFLLLLFLPAIGFSQPAFGPTGGGGGISLQQLSDTAASLRQQMPDTNRVAPGFEGQTKSYPGSMTLTTGSLTASVGNISGAAGMVQGYTGLFDTLLIKAGTNMSKQTTASITADGAQTNISLSLAPKGTGAFYLGPKADGLASGGNARGGGAIDLQIGRDNASQVVSGGAWAIGFGNTVSGNSSFAAGIRNTVSVEYNYAIGWLHSITAGRWGSSIMGGYSNYITTTIGTSNSMANAILGGAHNTSRASFSTVVGGLQGLATHYGATVSSSNSKWALGKAQTMTLRVMDSTGSAVPDTLTLSNTEDPSELSPQSSWLIHPNNYGRYMTIDSGAVWTFHALVSARSDVGDAGSYEITGGIQRVGATTSLVGTPTVTTLGETANATAWDVSAVADDTNDALHIIVTGAANKNIRWHATVTISTVGF